MAQMRDVKSEEVEWEQPGRSMKILLPNDAGLHYHYLVAGLTFERQLEYPGHPKRSGPKIFPDDPANDAAGNPFPKPVRGKRNVV